MHFTRVYGIMVSLPAEAYPGVAQLVARLLWEQDAVGSNPATRTIIRQNLVVLADFFLRQHRTIVSAAFAQSFAPSVQL